MSGSGKLLAPVHTCGRFWPDLGNSEVIHWTKNALSLVIDLTSQFEETAPGSSANRKRSEERASARITSGLPVILPKCTILPAIRLRDLSRRCFRSLLDSLDRIVVRLPRREVHLFTREQAIAFGPVNLEVARLNLVNLDAADVGSDS